MDKRLYLAKVLVLSQGRGWFLRQPRRRGVRRRHRWLHRCLPPLRLLLLPALLLLLLLLLLPAATAVSRLLLPLHLTRGRGFRVQ